MTRTYGFRIYAAEVYPNSFAGKDALAAHSGSNTVERIHELLERTHAAKTMSFEPTRPKNGEPAKKATTMTVGDPQRINNGFIHISVESGTVGSHKTATKAGSDPQDLTDRSAEAAYMIAFLFPRIQSSTFVIVSETIDNKDPIRKLLGALRKVGIEWREEERAADRTKKKEARSNGDPRPSSPDRFRLAFDVHQATDSAYLDDILGSAKSVHAVFKSHQPSSRGEGSRIERVLTIKLEDSQGQSVVASIASLWKRKLRADDPLKRSDGVSQLAGALESERLVDQGEGDRYDDASLRVEGEDGRTTIAVDTLKNIFTYPVSDGSPPEAYFYRKVAERLPIVTREAGITLNDINLTEVGDWFDAST